MSKNKIYSYIIILILLIVAIFYGLKFFGPKKTEIPSEKISLQKEIKTDFNIDFFKNEKYLNLKIFSGSIDIGKQGKENPFEPFEKEE